MHRTSKLAHVAIILVLGVSPVGAQEHERVAFDFGYPPALALLWRISDRVAFRPELAFSYSASGQNPKVWTVTPGASALVSIHPSGALTPYAGARLAGLWIKAGRGPEQWLTGVVAGARYAFEPHFGISAESGVAYNRFRFFFGPAGTPLSSDTWSIAPTGRVSALLYF